jgi:hypothetical protein
MSAVMDAIMQARLREIAQFMALPAEQIVHALAYVGADPAKLLVVANAMLADPNAEPVPPPRSWPQREWFRWDSLPRETQEYLHQRETERDKAVRRAQNEVGDLRKQLKLLQQPIGENNGTETN